MRILHLSFHIGCIRSINALMKDLGHEIDFKYCRPEIPYKITASIAEAIWEQYKDTWNTYDLIMTSDTVALSYIFLRKLDELKPKLLIWVCNRFDYAMGDEKEFYELLRKVSHSSDYLQKVKIVPYTEYERVYCGQHSIWVREPTLLPYGDVEGTQVFNGQVDKEEALKLDTTAMTDTKENTVFISFYHNDTGFFPFKEYLHMNGISVATGEFRTIEDLKQYKCIVTLPDAFSKFFYFELLNLGIPIFVPTEELFMKLNRSVNIGQDGKYNQYNFTYQGNVVPSDFVTMCEWYRHSETRTFFDTFEELIQKIKEFTPEKQKQVRRKMAHAAEYHRQNVISTTRKLLEDFNLE